MNTKSRLTLLAPLFLAAVISQISAQESAPQRLPGMAQQITVRKASELKVVAPSGEFVAVLDQTVSHRDPKVSKVVDHNNGWLQLAPAELGVGVSVKGKYFIPVDAEHKPTAFRFTIRRHTKTGLVILSENSIKLDAAQPGQWASFSTELPIKAEDALSSSSLFLLISAVPLAGPVYLDDLAVTGASGASLWAYPSFE